MSDTGSSPDLLDMLAHEFAKRLRDGERPGLTEYADRHPELAAEIRDLFPALEMMEQYGSVAGPATGPHPQTATADGTMPRQLGEYRILREVARGGMGIVYEAVQESLGRHVALKVLPFQSLADANHLERFRREAQAAAKLHHTNIVPVFGVGEHDGIHYFAMQLIHGQPLSSVLHELECRRRSGSPQFGEPTKTPFSDPAATRHPELTVALAASLVTGKFSGTENAPDDAAEGELEHAAKLAAPSSDGSHGAHSVTSGDRSGLGEQSDANYFRSVAGLGVQVAEALAYAHQQGIVHRDIKPSNLLLDTHGTVWVTDFGLAKSEGTGELTNPGDLLGTMRYMAPERFQGQADMRSDVFSLGLTLYEMVTLRPAFSAALGAPLIERMLYAEPPRPRQLDGRVPRDLETIILKAIAKEPNRRYQTAADLAADLQLFLADRPIRARESTAVERFGRWCRRNPSLAGSNIAAGALTTMLAIGATVAAWTFRDQRDQIGQHLRQVQRAEINGQERLFDSLSAQAGAGRQSRRIGQRFESLEAITQAATIARELKLPIARLDAVRDEAIGWMALPDIKPSGRVIKRPPGAIHFTFDASMTRYALRFRDGTIQVRRIAHDEEIARFRARGDRNIFIFDFSPDGRYLATLHYPGFALTVWDVEAGTACLNDPGPVTAYAAEFSPDSRRLILAHVDGELLVYELATGRSLRRWRGPALTQDLAFRPDGARIAVAQNGSEPSCEIIAADSGQLVRSIPLLSKSQTVAWNPDGTILATPALDRKIYLWDAATGARTKTLEGSINTGLCAAFHPAGTLLASNGYEGRLRLWDPVMGRSVLSVMSSGMPLFSNDGQINVASDDRFTSYQVDPAVEYRTFVHTSSPISEYRYASISYDGRLLAVGTGRGLALWDLARGGELAFLPTGDTWRAIFEKSGDLLTTGRIGVQRWPVRLDSAGGEFRIGPPHALPLPASDGGMAKDRQGHVVALADGNFAYVATSDRTIHFGPLDDCRSVAVSPDGEWLVTGSHTGTFGVQVWRIRDRAKVAELPLFVGTKVDFSPDGRWLMTTSSPCRLWSVDTWREERLIAGEGFCFSPDSQIVVVVDANWVIRLVAIETGRTLARFESPDLCEVTAANFSPDGSRLVITTNDGPAVHIWDLRAIRRKLAKMGLDWDAPAYSEDDPAGSSAPARPPLQVDLGPLPLSATVDARAYEPTIANLEAALARNPDSPRIRSDLARRCNDYAWMLANTTGSGRDPKRALTLALRSIELEPHQALYINTLGVVQYRVGQCALAVTTLDRSLAAGHGAPDSVDLLFQAMAHWRLGHNPQALACFRKAVLSIEKNRESDQEIIQFRAEASALLGLEKKPD